MVDQERGIVWAHAVFDQGTVSKGILSDGRPYEFKGFNRPSSILVTEAFLIENGKIRRVEMIGPSALSPEFPVAGRSQRRLKKHMKRIAIIFGIGLACAVCVLAQRPSNPALLVPQEAPPLDYVAVADPIPVPADVKMGASSSVAFDSKGHLFVLSRGAQPLTEFDENGNFIRAFGEGLFMRSHGLRIDKDGNIWVTDVGAHTDHEAEPRGTGSSHARHQGTAGRVE